MTDEQSKDHSDAAQAAVGDSAIRPFGDSAEDRTARNIGVGCFTFFIGGVSGAMTAVLLGKFYSSLTRAPQCSEMPLCNWYEFAGWGGLLGAITLPTLVLWRLRRADDTSDRKIANDTSK